MDYKFIIKVFTWILIIYLSICTEPGETRRSTILYRAKNSTYYTYTKSDSSGLSEQNEPDRDEPYESRNEQADNDDADASGASEASEGSEDLEITNYKGKGMMKVGDLTKLKQTHGKGRKKDVMAEEKIESVQSRAPKKRNKVKDGLGKTLSRPNCGQSEELAERVVGGKDAVEGAHPWIAAVLKDGEPWCGGTILNENWIITASHCFMGDEKVVTSSWAVRIGTNNRNSGPTFKISKIVSHERFNLDNMLNSDIAMMKTSKPMKFTKLIKPVCMPTNSYDEPRALKLIVAGWGAVKFDDENLPINLQEVSLNVVKDAECAKKYKQKKYTLYKSQVCTWNYKQDACQGDSGGPAVEVVDGLATLVGVVSYGSTCADDFPGVYTQVSYFLNWISTTMSNNS